MSRGSPFYKSSHSPFDLFIATHCWYCGPAKDQDACDKEIQYRECETFGPSICIAVNGLSQTYYMRTCLSKYDYDWEKWKCETRNFGDGIRSGRGMLCEIGRCSGDCIANVGNKGKQQNLTQPQPHACLVIFITHLIAQCVQKLCII